jgi:hypothetical protein
VLFGQSMSLSSSCVAQRQLGAGSCHLVTMQRTGSHMDFQADPAAPVFEGLFLDDVRGLNYRNTAFG